MKFPLTAAANGRIKPPVMADVQRLVGLADATGHLWRARDELLAVGYGSWAGGLIELLDAIALEIEWLSSEESESGHVA
jgi:hypothetical protein